MSSDPGNRRQRRVQVQNMTLSINGKTYQVFNLNKYGVGFLVDSPDEFTVGDEIRSMILNATLPVIIAGTPRHISAYPPSQTLHFRKGWVCGAEFSVKRDEGQEALIQQILRDTLAREWETDQ